jgi:hypothetical protein
MRQCLADAPGQMAVSRGNNQTLGRGFHRHDPRKRVFPLFRRLRVLHQAGHLFMLLVLEAAFESDEPLGILVANPHAGWAGNFVGIRGLRAPGPPSFVK